MTIWVKSIVNPLTNLGFSHGCKCAAVGPVGEVLHTEAIKIDFDKQNNAHQQRAATSLKAMIRNFR